MATTETPCVDATPSPASLWVGGYRVDMTSDHAGHGECRVDVPSNHDGLNGYRVDMTSDHAGHGGRRVDVPSEHAGLNGCRVDMTSDGTITADHNTCSRDPGPQDNTEVEKNQDAERQNCLEVSNAAKNASPQIPTEKTSSSFDKNRHHTTAPEEDTGPSDTVCSTSDPTQITCSTADPTQINCSDAHPAGQTGPSDKAVSRGDHVIKISRDSSHKRKEKRLDLFLQCRQMDKENESVQQAETSHDSRTRDTSFTAAAGLAGDDETQKENHVISGKRKPPEVPPGVREQWRKNHRKSSSPSHVAAARRINRVAQWFRPRNPEDKGRDEEGETVRRVSEDDAEEVVSADGDLLKYAEILYKCSLCTTLPCILTSPQAFLAHVSDIHLSASAGPATNRCRWCQLRFQTNSDLHVHVAESHATDQELPGEARDADVSETRDADVSDERSADSDSAEGPADVRLQEGWSGGEESSRTCPTPNRGDSFRRACPTPNKGDSFQRACPTPNRGDSFHPEEDKPERLPADDEAITPTAASQGLPASRRSSSSSSSSSSSTPLATVEHHSTHPLHHLHMLSRGQTLSPPHALPLPLPLPLPRGGPPDKGGGPGMGGVEGGLGGIHGFPSFTPEFGRFTKLVREGGRIVYFCQVCNVKCQVKAAFQVHCNGVRHHHAVTMAGKNKARASSSSSSSSSSSALSRDWSLAARAPLREVPVPAGRAQLTGGGREGEGEDEALVERMTKFFRDHPEMAAVVGPAKMTSPGEMTGVVGPAKMTSPGEMSGVAGLAKMTSLEEMSGVVGPAKMTSPGEMSGVVGPVKMTSPGEMPCVAGPGKTTSQPGNSEAAPGSPVNFCLKDRRASADLSLAGGLQGSGGGGGGGQGRSPHRPFGLDTFDPRPTDHNGRGANGEVEGRAESGLSDLSGKGRKRASPSDPRSPSSEERCGYQVSSPSLRGAVSALRGDGQGESRDRDSSPACKRLRADTSPSRDAEGVGSSSHAACAAGCPGDDGRTGLDRPTVQTGLDHPAIQTGLDHSVIQKGSDCPTRDDVDCARPSVGGSDSAPPKKRHPSADWSDGHAREDPSRQKDKGDGTPCGQARGHAGLPPILGHPPVPLKQDLDEILTASASNPIHSSMVISNGMESPGSQNHPVPSATSQHGFPADAASCFLFGKDAWFGGDDARAREVADQLRWASSGCDLYGGVAEVEDVSIETCKGPNNEGWKVSQIRDVLRGVLAASNKGSSVSRDVLLQRVSLLLRQPDVQQWGPACNRAVRDLFPHCLAQRKGKFKKTYFFGLSLRPGLEDTKGSDPPVDGTSFRPLRDMTQDLEQLLEHLPGLLYWSGHVDRGVSRDDVLHVLAARLSEGEVFQWGMQCNKALRMLFPLVLMKRKGKYKTVYFGVDFTPAAQRLLPGVGAVQGPGVWSVQTSLPS